MTPEEQRLWFNCLRHYPIKFYRQRPIAYYIADFYCSKAGLVIELDGSQHFSEEGKNYDDFRTEILERFGLEVIRFTNREICQQFDAVCRMIDHRVQVRMQERMLENPEHETPPSFNVL